MLTKDEMYENVVKMMDSEHDAIFALVDGTATVEHNVVDEDGDTFDVKVSWPVADPEDVASVWLTRR